MLFFKYPDAVDMTKVGTYPAEVFSGGGYFYDDVLEYRVWTKENGQSIFYAFGKHKDAKTFSRKNKNAEDPVVLVKQYEYIEETAQGFKHVKKPRTAEWEVKWLKGNKGTAINIPKFLKRKGE